MGSIRRITVHHEGSTPVTFTDPAATIRRLEGIRRYHFRERGWGDIGYHYVIDRSGYIWAARDLSYQGAHVKDHNERNLGIMVLGNFDEQRPSVEQFNTLQRAVATFMRGYDVPLQRVYTHRELTPGHTECPGRYLQQYMVKIRRDGWLG